MGLYLRSTDSDINCGAIIRNLPIVNAIAAEIGGVSTEIWLLHGPIYQSIIPKIIFFPKISLLVVVWLIAICYITGKMLAFAVDKFERYMRKRWN